MKLTVVHVPKQSEVLTKNSKVPPKVSGEIRGQQQAKKDERHENKRRKVNNNLGGGDPKASDPQGLTPQSPSSPMEVVRDETVVEDNNNNNHIKVAFNFSIVKDKSNDWNAFLIACVLFPSSIVICYKAIF